MSVKQTGSLNIVERLKDGSIVHIPVAQQGVVVLAKPGAQYALIDMATGKSPGNIQVKRKGSSLVIEDKDSSQVIFELQGFHEQSGTAFIPQAQLTGAALEGAALTAESPVLQTTANGEQIIWMESGNDGFSAPLLFGLLGAGGLALAVGGGGGGNGADGSAGGTGGTGGTGGPGGTGGGAPVSNTVVGTIVAGPVVAGNDLRVELFQADGITKLSEAVVNADGSFSIAVGSYMGVVIARVVNMGSNADYLDEATQQNKNLNASLSGIGVVTQPNSTVTLNINALTTLSYLKVNESAAGVAPSAAMVESINQAIAKLFGLPGLHDGAVVPINGGAFDNGDGMSAGEAYGAILAALSGTDALNGGDSQKSIDDLFAGLSMVGGAAALTEAAQAQLVKGAENTAGKTGQEIGNFVAVVVDTFAPRFDSANAVQIVDENLGTARIVHTAVASDAAGVVAYSLKPGADAAAFSIDAKTGAVTLTGNPDHETKANYSFTVVATDTAGNSSEQAVTLAVNNLDDTAPAISSGGIARAIDENSGTGQVVYTVTSTDSADVSAGATRYSLKTGLDAAAFSIDASTGAVTLTGNPDHEAKSSYGFTVIATDAAGNASEQAVTLAINNLDETAPAITSGGAATAINENSGAGQVVYTVTSTDNADIATGNTRYSLKTGLDAAAFSIDAGTGVVKLTGNPDHETKSSYSFTVVATDAAGNASEQVVTLAINNLDETAPAITSSGMANAIAENSGAGQVVYTVTSTDNADIATGSTRYSLKTGLDAAAFSIDANTGAVTLIGNPDYETKPSYSFTVVATDAAGNASEQAVNLAITDVIENTAQPTVSSVAITAAAEGQGNLLKAGDMVSVTVTLSETVLVTGTPRVALDIGGSTVYATYSSGSGTTALVFQYIIQPDQTAPDGIATAPNALQLDGGTLKNAAGTDVLLAHGSAANFDYQVDTTAPVLTSGATAAAIDENSGAGKIVYKATVTAGDAVTYSLKNADAALFSIDASNGEVTLIGNPDHETKASYSFTVVATDAAGNASEQVVTLAVNNLDDTAPVFTGGATATATAINENSAVGTFVYKAEATDTSVVTYRLDGTDAALFSINAGSGEVTLAGSLDHETKSSYSFTVVATDLFGNSIEQVVTLPVNDLDDTAPVFTGGATATAAAINENSAVGTFVYKAEATDTNVVTYRLEGTDAALFSINAGSGEVTLAGKLDYETKQSYSFTVVATDSATNISKQVVTLPVNDLDEVAPVFTLGATATAAAINENSAVGTFVYKAEATDTSVVTYRLEGTDAALFSINANSGEVTLAGNLDYEAKQSYSFTVVATDSATNVSKQVVTLPVNDLDDTAPFFTLGATATATAINENSAVGTFVYKAEATDTSVVTYRLEGTDAALFSINANSGEVTLAGKLDYETKQNYSFTVVATDLFGNSIEQVVTLPINDLDDTAPVFTGGATATATAINENSAVGTFVYKAAATDTSVVTYRLEGTDAALFSINADSGEVTLAGKLDYETKQSYSFTVVATDSATNVSKQVVTLPVNDLDEVAPVFTLGATATAAAINENSAVGTFVYKAAATDTSVVTYRLEGTDAALFSINADSGEVTLAGNLDYEAKQSYSFTVVATDSATNVSKQVVTLPINDLDEVAPVFTLGATATATAINENSAVGTFVYKAAATDTSVVTYRLEGTDAALFSINANSGEVTLAGNLDYETKQSYSFTVVATDSATNASKQVVTLPVNDLDEVAPVFTGGATATATAINENSAVGTFVYKAAATDTNVVTYRLEGTDAALFSINIDSGEVTLAGKLDYETKQSYSFTAVATDSATNVSKQVVTLPINDLDDTAPAVSTVAITGARGGQGSLLNAGDVVYVTVTMDDDVLVTGTPRIALDIGGKTVYADYVRQAVLDIGARVALDGSGTKSLVFQYTIQAGDNDTNGIFIATNALGLNGGTIKDAVGNNAVLTHVSVADNAGYQVDTTAPRLISVATAAAIDENSGEGKIVYQAAVTEGDTVTYSLTNADLALFSIDSISGEVTLIGAPDYETKSSYSFTVVATDAAGNASEKVVTLEIKNLDDTAPVITSFSTATAIAENSGAGQVVYTVTSTDSVDVSNGPSSYSLKPGLDAAAFSIDPLSGKVTLIDNPDYETKNSYSFTVVATDAAGNASEQLVTLNVINQDDTAPSITSGSTATAINENSGAGQLVYTVTSTDSSDVLSGPPSYSLAAGQDATAFSIDPLSGKVTLIDNPDYETKNSYSFTVVATDVAGNAREKAVTLAINDLEDTAPAVTTVAITGARGGQGSLLNAGDVVYVTVTMDDDVLVTGTPRIALNIGGSTVYATYSAGSGTKALVFEYTILANQTDSDGITIAANTLELNGGTLKDAAGNEANREHMEVSPSYLVDTTAPTVTNVDFSRPEGLEGRNLKAGDVILVTVALNEEVQISSSTPNLALAIGGRPVQASYSAQLSRPTALVFEYTVQSGDSGDIGIVPTGTLVLTGGTVQDAAGNAVVPAYETGLDSPSYLVDTTAPRVSGVSITGALGKQGNLLNAGDDVFVTVTLDEAVQVTGAPRVALDIGGSTVYATYSSGTGTTALVFQYTIQPGQTDTDGISIAGDALENIDGSTIKDAAGNSAVLDHAEQGANADYQVDTTSPPIPAFVNVAFLNENSGANQTVFSTSAVAGVTYSLQGLDAALFGINPLTGEVKLTGNPDYETKNSYSYTLVATDAAGNATEHEATLTIVDLEEIAPTVSSVAITGAIGNQGNLLNAGDDLFVTVTLSETVLVTGTPRIALNIGGRTVDAIYFSGNGSAALVFKYTIQTGQTDTDGISIAGNALKNINGSTIKDAAGNIAVLAHAAQGANAAYQVDTTPPPTTGYAVRVSVDEHSGANQTVVTKGAVNGVTYSLGGPDAEWLSINSLTGEVKLTVDPDYKTKSSYSFTLMATDAAGNTSEQSIKLPIIDPAPRLSSSTPADDATAVNAGSNIVLTFSENVVAGSGNIVIGSFNSSGFIVNKTLISVQDTSQVTISGNVVTINPTSDLQRETKYYVEMGSGVFIDQGGKPYAGITETTTLNFTTSSAVPVDSTAPSVRSVAITGASGGRGNLLNADDIVSVTVTTSEAVQVTGTPRLALNIGGSTVYANYFSGTGTTALVFQYTIQPGQTDTNGISIDANKLQLIGGATIKDAAGNNAVLTHAAVADNGAYLVDTTAPSVSLVAFSGSTGGQNSTLNAGDTVRVTVTMDEATIVDTTNGTPRIALNIGGSTVYATYSSGTGTTALVFQYAIQPGQTDTDGISIVANTLELNGGTLKDAADNIAWLEHGSAVNLGYQVDTTAPTLTSALTAQAIDENSGEGKVVYTATVSDSDPMTYSLMDGDAALFSINEVTGEVTLIGNPDYETKASYSFTVVATDNARNSSQQVVTLDINDLDDTAPPGPTKEIVVFDLLYGSSSGSDRTFKAGVEYTIYIRVDSGSATLTSQTDDSLIWGKWTGAENLGAGDKVVLVGSGSPVQSSYRSQVVFTQANPGFIGWFGSDTLAAGINNGGNMTRVFRKRVGFSSSNVQLWDGLWNSPLSAGRADSFAALGLNSQGLPLA